MNANEIQHLLKMSNKKHAPQSWSDLAAKYSIKSVFLVNDQKVNRSYIDHVESIIYVNEISTFWRNYSKAEYGNAKTPDESIVLKFLHEVGHAAYGHHLLPSAEFNTIGNTIATQLTNMKEAQAWKFATDFCSN
ncbi:hypothetical protein [Paenibacillus sp. FSL H3-0286]|uniref:hypothetical protein n=1 Tax=Paenibacillus sp. FSL H3-0286 TaxID=2921427 RepID=UPI00324F0CAD